MGRGSAPDPAGGAYNAPPDLLAGFKGLYTTKGGKDRGGEGKGMRGKEKGGQRLPPLWNPKYATASQDRVNELSILPIYALDSDVVKGSYMYVTDREIKFRPVRGVVHEILSAARKQSLTRVRK